MHAEQPVVVLRLRAAHRGQACVTTAHLERGHKHGFATGQQQVKRLARVAPLGQFVEYFRQQADKNQDKSLAHGMGQ